MVLVVGATGLTGSEICHKLRGLGEPVRALVRTTSSKDKIQALQSAGVELCFGDLKDRQSIAAACRGVDAVISTASSTLSRQPDDSIKSVDTEGQLNLVSAASNANVEPVCVRVVSADAGNIFSPGRGEGASREGSATLQLHHHPGQLLHGSVAEPGRGL